VGDLAIAATLWAPTELDVEDVRVLVCWPGGSYGRDYWDIRLVGRGGYSFAEHMIARGFIVIAADPLGVGAVYGARSRRSLPRSICLPGGRCI
jgi:hypothetical protein